MNVTALNITIENLTKSYGDQKAVDDLSFSVNTGEILGFLGPNGAGKTTTMKTISNYLEIESGDIMIGGRSLKDHAKSLKKSIGYLPENNPLYLEMSVIDYLDYCASLQGLSGNTKHKRIREMIALCGINSEKHKNIGELSKGYRQRVGLAQAMIHDPQILILDEPTTGLDPNQIVEIRKLIKDLGREKTVILSTHILPEVEATCDRILIINRGKIVADGTAESLKRQASGKVVHHVKVAGLNASGFSEKMKTLLDNKSVKISSEGKEKFVIESTPEVNLPQIVFEVCAQNNWYITEMTPVETSLEDIFRGLTV